MKRIMAIVASLAVAALLLCSSMGNAFPPSSWKKGDEKAIFGHTFEEEYWTNPSVGFTTPAGDNVTYSASYVNYRNVQAFLFSLNMVENKDGSGNVPFQLFGMHYYTKENREVFIGSVFAFLMAFNDTYNGAGAGQNNLPDPGNEKVYYIIPFGVGKHINETYPPQANVLEVKRLGAGHYTFGMQYKNLYAFVVENFLASAILSTGLIAKFSELTITYDIRISEETGEVTAESFYTIGQVSELWAIILGIPIQIKDPHSMPSNFGISAVHFITVFTSKYVGAYGNESGKQLDTNINDDLEEDISIKVGSGERAMKVGTRGTYDVINETTGTKLQSGKTAYAAIVSAKAIDLLLVAWQLGFSAGCMSIFAYALSKDVQAKYTGPKDLADRSLVPGNKDGFFATPLWYAVSFPGWNNYRVEHDPVYTAYANLNPQTASSGGGAVVLAVIVILVIAVIAIVIVFSRKKKP